MHRYCLASGCFDAIRELHWHNLGLIQLSFASSSRFEYTRFLSQWTVMLAIFCDNDELRPIILDRLRYTLDILRLCKLLSIEYIFWRLCPGLIAFQFATMSFFFFLIDKRGLSTIVWLFFDAHTTLLHCLISIIVGAIKLRWDFNVVKASF